MEATGVLATGVLAALASAPCLVQLRQGRPQGGPHLTRGRASVGTVVGGGGGGGGEALGVDPALLGLEWIVYLIIVVLDLHY